MIITTNVNVESDFTFTFSQLVNLFSAVSRYGTYTRVQFRTARARRCSSKPSPPKHCHKSCKTDFLNNGHDFCLSFCYRRRHHGLDWIRPNACYNIFSLFDPGHFFLLAYTAEQSVDIRCHPFCCLLFLGRSVLLQTYHSMLNSPIPVLFPHYGICPLHASLNSAEKFHFCLLNLRHIYLKPTHLSLP